uniref:Uncharacterized protein n=1 Tax=Arundo donax TaxID=35708 RepID=A0A0A9C4D0_ARUDO
MEARHLVYFTFLSHLRIYFLDCPILEI